MRNFHELETSLTFEIFLDSQLVHFYCHFKFRINDENSISYSNAKLLTNKNHHEFATVEQSALAQAIFRGNADEVRSLIYRKCDVNEQDNEKRTPLHIAAFLGDVEITSLLILNGARVNCKDSQWLTPVHRACRSGKEVGGWEGGCKRR